MKRIVGCIGIAVTTLLCCVPSAQAAPRTGALCLSPDLATIHEGNGALWRNAFEQFVASHPELTAEQRSIVADALNLAPAIATIKGEMSAPPDLVSHMIEVVTRIRAALPTSTQGELFSRMGPMQGSLEKLGVIGTPYCDCAGTGACGGGGQPSGTCQAGCISWDSGGTRYDGLCGTSLEE